MTFSPFIQPTLPNLLFSPLLKIKGKAKPLVLQQDHTSLPNMLSVYS